MQKNELNLAGIGKWNDTHTPIYSLQSVVQSEDVVVNVVLSRRGADELEHLAEVEGVVAADLDGAGDEDEHGIGIVRGLDVHGLDRVLDRAHGLVLGDYGRTTLNLVALERQHGGVLVKPGQTIDVGVLHLVVVLGESLGNFVGAHGGIISRIYK